MPRNTNLCFAVYFCLQNKSVRECSLGGVGGRWNSGTERQPQLINEDHLYDRSFQNILRACRLHHAQAAVYRHPCQLFSCSKQFLLASFNQNFFFQFYVHGQGSRNSERAHLWIYSRLLRKKIKTRAMTIRTLDYYLSFLMITVVMHLTWLNFILSQKNLCL